ncbi:MAG: sugar transferase [Chitinispirillaceae bacterium]|nr:sugar transferase [Chitinispirillaceae bacterium]
MNGEWFPVFGGRRSVPERRRSGGSLAGGALFLNEKEFQSMLAIERKRAERSAKHFLLVLVDLQASLKKHSADTSLETIHSALSASCRQIDIKGWYRQGQIVGIIYTECSEGGRTVICEKLLNNLTDTFPHTEIAQWKVSCIVYPGEGTEEDCRVIRHLYPDSVRASVGGACRIGMKRAIDIIGSVAGLLLFAPFFIMIPLLIKATSRGPVLFRQQRVGQGGKHFTFLKFRSMYADNDDSVHVEFMRKHIRGSGAACGPGEPAKTQVFKMVNDPRVTPLGALLRRTSLDELPQLINVLRGEMSLVGPRPAIPYEVREYDHWHLERIFPVKPGITGIWQVEGRSCTSFDAMVRMDINYIQRWSLMMDLKLIFKTPFSMLSARGAY